MARSAKIFFHLANDTLASSIALAGDNEPQSKGQNAPALLLRLAAARKKQLTACAGKSAASLPWIASTLSVIELASIVAPPPSLAAEALPVEFLSSFLVRLLYCLFALKSKLCKFISICPGLKASER